MYRTGKRINGRGNVLTLWPLAICAVSTIFLSVVEGARVTTSRRDVEEAEKIVARFLRNEAGATWLSGLAKGRSSPLTSQDLMNEILGATRPGGKVFKAATIISQSLKDDNPVGSKKEFNLGRSDNWKEIIAHIENQDDIICLYRKNSEETAKKAEDWKKFLKTVSPGYNVHLAIDTGRKYVICLKKIDVLEITTDRENSTIETNNEDRTLATSEATSSTTSSTTSTTTSSTTSTKLEITSDIKIRDDTNDTQSNDDGNNEKSKIKNRYVDDNCDDDDSRHNDDNEEKIFDKVDRTKNEEIETRNEINDDNDFVEGDNDDRQSVNSRATMREEIGLISSKDSDCNRPIVLLVQNGNVPSGYEPVRPLEISHQRNRQSVGLPIFSSPPSHFNEFIRNSRLTTATNRPVKLFAPFGRVNDFSRFTDTNNLNGKPPIFHRTTFPEIDRRPIFLPNTRVTRKDRREKMWVNDYSIGSSIKPIAQPSMIGMAKPIVRTSRKPLVPMFVDVKSRGSVTNQRKRDFMDNSRYQIGDNVPRAIRGQTGIGDFSSIIRRPAQTKEPNLSARNHKFQRRRITDRADSIDHNVFARLSRARSDNRQSTNTGNRGLPSRPSIFHSRSQPIDRKFSQPTINRNLSPLIGIANPTRSKSLPIVDRQMFLQQTPSTFSRYDRNNKHRPTDLLIKNEKFDGLDRNPRGPSYNTNYPIVRNYGRTNNFDARGSTDFSRPCPVFWNGGIVPGKGNSGDADFLERRVDGCGDSLIRPEIGNSLRSNSRPCPSPCDRPIKLQIVINGNTQEASKVSVINEPGRSVEIVGSDDSMIPYGSRSMRHETLSNNPDDDDETKPLKMAEVEESTNDLSEDNEKFSYNKNAKNQAEEMAKNETNGKLSSIEITSDKSEKSNGTVDSTTKLRTEITTKMAEVKDSGGSEIGERFLHEETVATSPGEFVAEANSTTLIAVTNSTIVEESVDGNR